MSGETKISDELCAEELEIAHGAARAALAAAIAADRASDERVKALRAALDTYHSALDNRENGHLAAHDFVRGAELIFDRHWVSKGKVISVKDAAARVEAAQ